MPIECLDFNDRVTYETYFDVLYELLVLLDKHLDSIRPCNWPEIKPRKKEPDMFANRDIWVYKRRNKIIGLLISYRNGNNMDCYCIEWLYVDSNCRSSGIGGKLINKVSCHAKSIGCKRLDLWYFPANKTAERLYEKHGFKPFNVYTIKKL